MAPTISAALAGAIEDLANRWQEMAIKGEVGQVNDFLTAMASQLLSYGNYSVIAVVEQATTADDRNVAGLASAIALANALKGHMNTHAADGTVVPGEHNKGGASTPDVANFPVVTPNASDLASLKTLCLALFTAYAAHDVDAVGATTYHNQTANAHTLVSALIPATLAEAITRLNDLKAKYNAHYVDAGTGAGASHTASTGPDEATVNAANGNACTIACADALAGDVVQWGLVSGGAGPKTGVSAAAGTGVVTFTMSAPPVSDVVVSYTVLRAN